MVRATTTGRRGRRSAATTSAASDGSDAQGPLAGPNAVGPDQDASMADKSPAETPAPEAMPDTVVDTVPEGAGDTVQGSAPVDLSSAEPSPGPEIETDLTPDPEPATETPSDPEPALGQADLLTEADTLTLPASDTSAEPSPELPVSERPDGADGESAQPGAGPWVDPVPLAVPAAAPAERRGFLGPVIGGIVAAGLGAGAVMLLLPQGWQRDGAGVQAFESRLAALENQTVATPDLGDLPGRVAALETEVAQVSTAEVEPVDLSPLTARLEALEAALAEAAPEAGDGPDLSPLLDRIAALEGRDVLQPDDLSALTDRIAALETDLPDLVAREVGTATADLRAEFTEQAEEIAASAEDLAAAQARAEGIALLGELGLAADTGAPAAATLDQLAQAQDVPARLDAFRAGLPTLGALQAAYPAAARAALAAAPPPEDAGIGDRIGTFFRTQTGARSLAPREGASTDAILSRAEVAVRQGNLAGALDELASLPPEPAAAMANWRAQVETRQAALAALADLSARLGQD